MAKLTYKILGRETVVVGPEKVDRVAVEWRHADGPVQDHVLLPKSHPPIHESMPEVTFKEVPSGTREVIPDTIMVPHGTPDSIVMQICEEKRARLAANLGVEP